MANKDGYALEHRYVLYEAGIEVAPGMHTHHKNGDRTDNRLENLEVKSPRDHHIGHITERGFAENQFGRYPLKTTRPCAKCGEPFMPWNPKGKYCSRECSNARHAV